MSEDLIGHNSAGAGKRPALQFKYVAQHHDRFSAVYVRPAGETRRLFRADYEENGTSSTHSDLRTLLYLAVHHIRGECEDRGIALPEEMEFTSVDGQETHTLKISPY